ncbi:MAG: hypothetical protein ACM3XR_07770 [Bacillota bacterium]
MECGSRHRMKAPIDFNAYACQKNKRTQRKSRHPVEAWCRMFVQAKLERGTYGEYP